MILKIVKTLFLKQWPGKSRYVLASGLLFLFLANPVSARDITALAIEHTVLQKRIVEGCQRYCLGNLREGRLIDVNIERISPILHRVKARASFKNHQVINSQLTGNFTLFNYIIRVNVTGELDQTNCELTVTKVDISGDDAGLIKGAQNAVGRIINVPKCSVFI